MRKIQLIIEGEIPPAVVAELMTMLAEAEGERGDYEESDSILDVHVRPTVGAEGAWADITGSGEGYAFSEHLVYFLGRWHPKDAS